MSGRPSERPLERLADAFAGAFLDPGGPGFDVCCTRDVAYEDPLAPEPLRGLDALDLHAAGLRSAFSRLEVRRTAPALGEGPYVCVSWRLSGRNTGELDGLPPTGRAVALHGVHMLELVDGRIRRARGFFDLYALGRQLALMPPRGGVGETAMLFLRGYGVRPRG